jgi:hypothetical protein
MIEAFFMRRVAATSAWVEFILNLTQSREAAEIRKGLHVHPLRTFASLRLCVSD